MAPYIKCDAVYTAHGRRPRLPKSGIELGRRAGCEEVSSSQTNRQHGIETNSLRWIQASERPLHLANRDGDDGTRPRGVNDTKRGLSLESFHFPAFQQRVDRTDKAC